VVRDGKNFKGRVLGHPSRKHRKAKLTKACANTVKAIDERSNAVPTAEPGENAASDAPGCGRDDRLTP
jgi:hypothetical protein